MARLLPALALVATLGGCANLPPAVNSDLLGGQLTVTALSPQEWREKAIDYCRETDRLAFIRAEALIDRGDRCTYKMNFVCDGYNPNLYRGGISPRDEPLSD